MKVMCVYYENYTKIIRKDMLMSKFMVTFIIAFDCCHDCRCHDFITICDYIDHCISDVLLFSFLSFIIYQLYNH